MNVFIVLAHPEINSLNGELFKLAVKTFTHKKDCQVITSDLYKMNFNPVSDRRNYNTVKNKKFFNQQIEELHASIDNGFKSDIEDEINKLEWCDLMIWQFPLWWMSTPAILKGWVDRVFAMGRIYTKSQKHENGILKGKKALLSLTTGAPEEAFKDSGYNGCIQNVLKPIHNGILKFVGFEILTPNIIYQPNSLNELTIKSKIEAYENRLKKLTKSS